MKNKSKLLMVSFTFILVSVIASCKKEGKTETCYVCWKCDKGSLPDPELCDFAYLAKLASTSTCENFAAYNTCDNLKTKAELLKEGYQCKKCED